MQFVFMDEAGTDPSHPVTVVVAVLVDADKYLVRLEAALNEELGAIPPQLGPDYQFSAKDVWGNPGYRDFWRLTDRINLLKKIMSLPLRMKLPIAAGVCHRGEIFTEGHAATGMRPDQLDHMLAFMHCPPSAPMAQI